MSSNAFPTLRQKCFPIHSFYILRASLSHKTIPSDCKLISLKNFLEPLHFYKTGNFILAFAKLEVAVLPFGRRSTDDQSAVCRKFLHCGHLSVDISLAPQVKLNKINIYTLGKREIIK